MINNRVSQAIIVALYTVLAYVGIGSVGQQLFNHTQEQQGSNVVLAQTSDEQIARQVYQKASPAVVTVQTSTGNGSGFVVSVDGLIITNAHVIKPPPQNQEQLNKYDPKNFPSVVTVVFSNGKKASADVLGFGKSGLDLAVLKIYNQKKLPTLALAGARDASVGDRVFALGTPLGADYKDTFTQGHITRIDSKTREIQHDAVIQGGNSGGPLLNTKAQVIGVNTAGIGVGKFNSGMNFAIAVSQVQSFLSAARKKDISDVSTVVATTKPTVATISLNGQVINGSLAPSDRILKNGNGSVVNLYQFQGQTGQKVVIEMASQKINPVLGLYEVTESSQGRGLKQIAENDDRRPGDLNAQIEAILPENGVYLILATSQERGETGSYSLRATAKP